MRGTHSALAGTSIATTQAPRSSERVRADDVTTANPASDASRTVTGTATATTSRELSSCCTSGTTTVAST